MNGIYIKDEQGWLSMALVDCTLGLHTAVFGGAALGINYAKLHLKTPAWMGRYQLVAVYYLSPLLQDDSKFHGEGTHSVNLFPTAGPQAGRA